MALKERRLKPDATIPRPCSGCTIARGSSRRPAAVAAEIEVRKPSIHWIGVCVSRCFCANAFAHYNASRQEGSTLPLGCGL